MYKYATNMKINMRDMKNNMRKYAEYEKYVQSFSDVQKYKKNMQKYVEYTKYVK